MSTVFITGGGGLVGSFICRELFEGDYPVSKVVVLDNFSTFIPAVKHEYFDYRKLRFAWTMADQVVFERGAANHYGVVSSLLRRYRPEYVIHLAALPLAKLQNLNVEEAQEGAITSTLQLLQILGTLKQEGVLAPKKFIYTSSSMVYGDFQEDPAPETHPTNPTEIYGSVKLAGEVITRGLCRFFDLPYAIIRPSAVYGPTDMNRRVSQIFIEKAIRREELSVHGGDDERLDFSFVRDVARGFALALFSECRAETFNITGGNAHSLLQFVHILKKNHFPDLQFTIKPRDTSRPKRGTLDISKARRLLDYQPQYDLERGIAETVAFIQGVRADALGDR